eukprot:2051567-Prymnesium_polylepis.1
MVDTVSAWQRIRSREERSQDRHLQPRISLVRHHTLDRLADGPADALGVARVLGAQCRPEVDATLLGSLPTVPPTNTRAPTVR